jgi:hypothetical protein
MFATRWFRRLWFASRSPVRGGNRKRPARQLDVRPCLESLEDRVCPSTFPTTTSISAAAPSFSLFGQSETVTTQTNVQSTGTGVNGQSTNPTQTITITDGGQSQTASVNGTGQATATFQFTLGQELLYKTYGSHAISASYPGFPSGVADANQTYGSSSASGTAPGNTLGFFFQLALDSGVVKALSSTHAAPPHHAPPMNGQGGGNQGGN